MFTSLVPDYCIYRVDRQGRSCGVALLYHNSVMSSSPIAICVDGIESIWVSVAVSSIRSILIGCVYRKPSCTFDNLHEWFRNVGTELFAKHNEIAWMGDLNLPHIN